MIPATAGNQDKDAFRLYAEGKYLESLDVCNRLLETTRDPALEILAATNLFSLGKLEEAEVYFRDLARKMPESSHVHSYLAKVLEQRGDEGAIAEYASAVRLDPDNQDALRRLCGKPACRKGLPGGTPGFKTALRARETARRLPEPGRCPHPDRAGRGGL